jgi:hypothetical protein
MDARKRTNRPTLYGKSITGLGGPLGRLESETGAESPPPPKTRLRVYRLATESERDALRRLKLARGDRSAAASFRGLILSHLHLIEFTVIRGRQKSPNSHKLSEVVRELRRRAARVRRFAVSMERPFKVPLLWPSPPVGELLRYADGLTAHAESLAHPPDSPYPPVSTIWIRASHRAKGQPPRRTERPESRLIFDLLQVTRQRTGQSHLRELAILLRGPCQDVAINEKRLGALWNFYSKKQRRHLLLRLARRSPAWAGTPIPG